MMKSLPGPANDLVVVGAAVDEVLTVAAHEDVVADAAVDGVVARAALEDVGSGQVGDDVVAVTTEGDVVAAVAFDDVVADATPEGVVVVAAPDAIDAVGAVVHGLAVDADRIDAVDLAVLDRAVRLAEQQPVLVAVGRGRIVGDEPAPEGSRSRRRYRQVAELELAVGRRECVGLQRVRVVRVAHDQFGERVALELGAQVHARGAGEVVQAVAVLEVLQRATGRRS